MRRLVACLAVTLAGCLHEPLLPVHPVRDAGPWTQTEAEPYAMLHDSLCPAFCIGNEANLTRLVVLYQDGSVLLVHTGWDNQAIEPGALQVPPRFAAWSDELEDLDRLTAETVWPDGFHARYVDHVATASLAAADLAAVRDVLDAALAVATPGGGRLEATDCGPRNVYVRHEHVEGTSYGCGLSNGQGWDRAIEQLERVWALVGA